MPAWIGAGIDQATPSGSQRLNEGHWLILATNYDEKIRCEKAGGAPEGVRGSWTDLWDGIFHSLVSTNDRGAYTWERPDIYMTYIVDRRRIAGLPDLPSRLTDLIPKPQPGAPAPPPWTQGSATELLDRESIHSGGPRSTYCLPWPNDAQP
ncbi:MAG: hypothetical protein JWP28_4077 [Phenylobacterium sp.]|nr:hypothetical protein [Phenylobacterium sp.]